MAVRHFAELVAYTVLFNLKAATRNYALGYLWWIIEPVLHLLILFLVFGVFFGQSAQEHYIPFLLCGLVPWIWFHKSVSGGMGSIVSGRSIIMDADIPKVFFPTVAILQDFTRELIVLACLIVTLLIAGVAPRSAWLFLPVVIALQLILIASVVYLLSIGLPYLLDLGQIMPALLQVLMFGSGTFYDYRDMPEAFQPLFLLNPVALLIGMYRDVLIHGTPINLQDCAYILGIAGVLGLMNLALYRTLDKDVPRILFR